MTLDIIIIIILSIFGIGLIIAEVFLIPGFGIAGIGGLAFLSGAIWFAYEQLGTTAGNITLLISIIFLILGLYLFVKSKMLNKVALKKEIDSVSPNAIEKDIKVGDIGKAISIINPMGTVLVNNQTVEAKSEEGFIEVNKEVEIVKVFKTAVVVREHKD
ncbi:MAG: NfeD family protein [Bacteroidales bacterium]|nr:NfeD family protein [Bacteroidales bacterium]